ncbi:hypothetical protein [Salisediminibacterium halotolerans]|uniref:hypothetical protein n=1 Tax=Salisediminibacterium halotolerans TaxID=517425 RepID=UPI000EAC094D|nr:hypothetical protein [Salisediminibacterium halotolerans]RLJ75490.1 hypothetical protein BCL39_1005 [Actinophytocola xinjiangensis]RPE89343.1 hypothetical protein EDD67_0118 [Salisediminibacterium halotolerans]TWG36103.1 hypothetical protein BCL52_1003 [Salisediminibacterium halotolerans]GEL08027.1 hypothetical protein SHA02_14430 [Salisediminibacterium halotolerans]
MTQQLTEAQQTFLTHYRDMLSEVERSVAYVSECYIKEDYDIGDRLLKSVIESLAAYNIENMTMDSIFSSDAEAVQVLGEFQEAASEALNVDEVHAGEGERMHFTHEVLLPRLAAWGKVVDRYLAEINAKG